MTQSRTHNCNELRIENVGEKVTIVGWYDNMRKVSKNLGFLVLRDFYGVTQAVIETEEMMEALSGVNNESTLSITGTVRERSSKNTNLPTGDIEVVPEKIEVLGKCIYNELPFEVTRSKEADEAVRLKYRYLDLRNPEVRDKIVLRSKIVADLRRSMIEHDFLEITTPILTCSSPEGARDYLVPSRNHPGKFYALPQAPQQFKQILMTSGFDRYFRSLPASGMRMREPTDPRENSISLIWKWRLPIRRMFLRLSRMFCLRFLQSTEYTLRHHPHPLREYLTGIPWKLTVRTNPIFE